MSSFKYAAVDKVVESLLGLGKGSLMAKLDIKQAYRNVPVCHDCIDWHGLERKGLH